MYSITNYSLCLGGDRATTTAVIIRGYQFVSPIDLKSRGYINVVISREIRDDYGTFPHRREMRNARAFEERPEKSARD